MLVADINTNCIARKSPREYRLLAPLRASRKWGVALYNAQRQLWPIVLAMLFTSMSVAVAQTSSGQSSKSGAETTAGQTQHAKSNLKLVRLVVVNIPTDSPHRDRKDINHPPKLYVKIKRNGVYFDGGSTRVEGWDASFPVDKKENRWPIRVGTKDRYDIEIWDSQTGLGLDALNRDVLILSVTQLTGEKLRSEVVEVRNNTAQSRCVKIKFEDDKKDLPTTSPSTKEP